MNLVQVLHKTFGMSREELGTRLKIYADIVYPDTHSIDKWLSGAIQLPSWVNQSAAKIMIQLWIKERSACQSGDLLQIDKKYTVHLKSFSMGEVLSMKNALSKNYKT